MEGQPLETPAELEARVYAWLQEKRRRRAGEPAAEPAPPREDDGERRCICLGFVAAITDPGSAAHESLPFHELKEH